MLDSAGKVQDAFVNESWLRDLAAMNFIEEGVRP
jgi:hypothetical protein